MADYGNYWSSTNAIVWNGSTSAGSSGWDYNRGYAWVSISPGIVMPRSDAQQINEGWDADQNPS